jgi:RNA polymerase sigma-70 factor (ECF subfamily)
MSISEGVPLSPLSPTAPPDASAANVPAKGPVQGEWLRLFHDGHRPTMEACYRAHFATVERAIGPLLRGADRETLIHELFSQLLFSVDMRRSFQGGAFGAWISTVARNRAIDFARRLGREVEAAPREQASETAPDWQEAADARMLIDRFRREHLPEDWQGVFDLRFLQQLPQREAAQRLSMRRTTLAYRELRIRRLLRSFLLDEEEST